jgi:DNA-binding transcriptional MerR regulator
MSISELAEEAGVSVRTVRYYVSEGLLPRRERRGRYASYGERYLKRLNLIARLKQSFLPLKEIRTRLSGLSDVEVDALLEELSSESAKEPHAVWREQSSPVHSDIDIDSDKRPEGHTHWTRHDLEYGLELFVVSGLPPWRQRIVQRILAMIDDELRDW